MPLRADLSPKRTTYKHDNRTHEPDGHLRQNTQRRPLIVSAAGARAQEQRAARKEA